MATYIGETCKKYSNKPAFTCMGHTLTFKEIDQHSTYFASYLQNSTKLQSGDRIAIQLPNILQFPVAVFGALKAGLVIVNTNPLYTARELKHQLNDSGAKCLLTFANFASIASEVVEETSVEHVIVTQLADLHPFAKRHAINLAVKYIKKMVPHYNFKQSINFRHALAIGKTTTFIQLPAKPGSATAMLQYTGGTTGVSKGAILSSSNVLSNVEQIHDALGNSLYGDNEVVLAPLPLYHIYAFTTHCMFAFGIGAHNILVPNPRELKSYTEIMTNYDVTCIVGINTLFNSLSNNQEFSSLDFSNLRVTVSGGMALSPDTANRWKKITQCEVFEGYGMTEASPVVSFNSPEQYKANSVGKAVIHTQVKLETESDQSSDTRQRGELLLKGPQITQGYWNNPEATADLFNDEGWLRTGDIATIDDEGFISIVDRKKDMIIVSGFNVYPNEIEDVLTSHPNVAEAAVIGTPDSKTGEAVKAFIILNGSPTEDAKLKEHCQDQLTGYKVPKYFEFVNELPKNNVGKVLRRMLN